MAAGTAGGVPIRVSGKVLDGDGAGVPDAVIEIWQADSNGDYPERGLRSQSEFTGFARVDTDEAGAFARLIPTESLPEIGGYECAHDAKDGRHNEA